MRDLGVNAVADLNNRGDIVGSTGFPSGYHGYLMRRSALTDLGTLSGGTFSEAHAINNNGWIAGDADTAANPGTRGAFLWRNGTMHALPGPTGSTYSTVTTLNDRGQVLGQSIVADQLRAVLWQDGTVIDLSTRGIRSGGMEHSAGALRDINRFGRIAGAYYFTYGQPGPAIFV
jgi:probable HAF family extracellular repeat protein